MLSLSNSSRVLEEGVYFQGPVDGTEMLLTPEKSIAMQNDIGVDIIMTLDDVVPGTLTGPRVEDACRRTLRWIHRCVHAHSKKDRQSLFGIVQGRLGPILRRICCEGMVKRNLPGYAIEGSVRRRS